MIVEGFRENDGNKFNIENILDKIKPYVNKKDFKSWYVQKNPIPKDKIPIVSLYYSVISDYLPSKNDIKTLNIGFIKCKSDEDEINTLGLYHGLIVILNCKIDEFYIAYKNNKIVNLIKNKFERIDEKSRGEYYLWFLKNTYIFEY